MRGTNYVIIATGILIVALLLGGCTGPSEERMNALVEAADGGMGGPSGTEGEMLHQESITVTAGTYRYYPCDLGKGDEVTVTVLASQPIDIMFLDAAAFAGFKEGSTFEAFTDGTELGTDFKTFTGEIADAGRYYLVVDNSAWPDGGAYLGTDASVDTTVVRFAAGQASPENTLEKSPLYAESMRLSGGMYRYYPVSCQAGDLLRVAILAGEPVDVFLLDAAGFESYQARTDFESYTTGTQLNTDVKTYEWTAPARDTYYVIVDNSDSPAGGAPAADGIALDVTIFSPGQSTGPAIDYGSSAKVVSTASDALERGDDATFLSTLTASARTAASDGLEIPAGERAAVAKALRAAKVVRETPDIVFYEMTADGKTYTFYTVREADGTWHVSGF
ncbi:MAG: hypothetical protein WBZ29_01675 [Methanocella sp.]